MIMTRSTTILVNILVVVCIIALGIWGYNQYQQANRIVIQPPSKTTVTIPAKPETNGPIKPFFTSDKGFPGPSIIEAQNLLHVSVVRVGTEFSTFNWRGVPQNIELFMAKGFIFTVHTMKDEVVVIVGNDKPTRAKGFTARYMDAFPQADAVHRPLELVQKEQIHLRESNPNAIVTLVTELPLP